MVQVCPLVRVEACDQPLGEAAAHAASMPKPTVTQLGCPTAMSGLPLVGQSCLGLADGGKPPIGESSFYVSMCL
jgi:hypothetical protein